jgi:hypothetical protein
VRTLRNHDPTVRGSTGTYALVRLIAAITSILLAFTCTGCLAPKNPLLGTWRMDDAKTLQEFQSPTEGSAELKGSAAKAKAFVEAVAKNLTSNVTLTYTDKSCTEAAAYSRFTRGIGWTNRATEHPRSGRSRPAVN